MVVITFISGLLIPAPDELLPGLVRYQVIYGGGFLEKGSSGYSAGRHHGDHLFAADYPELCAAEPDREDPVL